jgi:hypothetical protein
MLHYHRLLKLRSLEDITKVNEFLFSLSNCALSLETCGEGVRWKLPDARATSTPKLPREVLLKYLLIHPQGQASLTSTKRRDSLRKDVLS